LDASRSGAASTPKTSLGPLDRRVRRLDLVIAMALLCSGVAIAVLGFGARRLWPPPPVAGQEPDPAP
ncbi:MAG TPA: hypothetical protein VFZ61_22655, partial [Polyangiales bacterium]